MSGSEVSAVARGGGGAWAPAQLEGGVCPLHLWGAWEGVVAVRPRWRATAAGILSSQHSYMKVGVGWRVGGRESLLLERAPSPQIPGGGVTTLMHIQEGPEQVV